MRILILLFTFFFSFSVLAQERPTPLKDGEALQGEFSQKRFLSGFERPLLSAGQFYFDPQQGLLWKTKTPFKTQLLINAEGITQSVDAKETMKLPTARYPELATLHQVLVQALRGQWQDLEERYGAKIQSHQDGWTISFKADKDAPFDAIEMHGAAFMEKLVIKKPAGDFDEIVFQQQMVTQVKK